MKKGMAWGEGGREREREREKERERERERERKKKDIKNGEERGDQVLQKSLTSIIMRRAAVLIHTMKNNSF